MIHTYKIFQQIDKMDTNALFLVLPMHRSTNVQAPPNAVDFN